MVDSFRAPQIIRLYLLQVSQFPWCKVSKLRSLGHGRYGELVAKIYSFMVSCLIDLILHPFSDE